MRAPLSEDEIDQRLRAMGLVRDPSIASPPPSKNRTVVCVAGKKRVLVKIADGSGNYGVLREGSVLERVQPLGNEPNSPLALPQIHAFDPVQGFLVLDWLHGSETLHHFHRRTLEYPESVAEQLGSALAFLHQRSHDAPGKFALAEAFRDETDLVECFLHLRPDFFARLSSVGLELCSSLQRNRAAMQGLEQLSHWQSRDGDTCLLHGDMRQANVVRVGKTKVPPLVFLDWELSLWGDPARDLGSLLSDYVLECLFPEHPSELMSTDTLQRFCGALMRQYFAGRTVASNQRTVLQERVIRWVGAALLIYVYGISHYEQHFDSRADGIARQSLEMLSNPARWYELLWKGL